MDHSAGRSRRLTWRATAYAGTAAAIAVAVAAAAPTASAAPSSVRYGSCTSSNPVLAAPPPDYTTQVTLTPQGSGFQAGKAITITWHYSVSTAPAAIPLANVATAKAKIVVGGAASSTITTGDSPAFPPAPVDKGGTFQIPDMTATFTPPKAGTYTLTPGDNEQDVPQFKVVVNCKAGGAQAAATITVAAGTPGSGSSSTPSTPGSGSTTPSGTSSTTPSSTDTGSATDTGSPTATGSGTGTDTGTGSATTSTSTLSTLPHTGFDGRWLAGAAGLAAVLGAGGLAAGRRRRGGHG